MTDRNFNAALATLNKLEEHRRIARKLDHRVDILGEAEALVLLRKIEALL